jgi:UDP-glucuronate 4-epimerase
LINISTSSVYGADATGDEQSEPRPTSFYGVTKLAAEQLVMAAYRAGALPACSFRLFSVYGPRERPDKLFPTLIRSILKDEPFPLFEGSEQHERSFTYVGDIVAGLAAAATKLDACRGEIINLGIDTAITTGEAIQIVESVLGKPAIIQRQPRRAGDQARTQANIVKARRLLDYQPETKPADGLRQTIAWYTERVAMNLEGSNVSKDG